MEKRKFFITNEDISALEKVFSIVKDFTEKNPIRKSKINFDQIYDKITELKNNSNKNDDVIIKNFIKIVKRFKSIISKEVYPKIFYIIGGHGGIILNGIGYCEFDYPELALNRLLEVMSLAIETEIPYNLEIAISCLKCLKNNYPASFSKILELYKRGKFDIINPTFSQPYCLIIGAESNIKQIEFGLRELKKLGLECRVYYSSEASLHPQIPQILKGFNIPYSSLRTRLLGTCPTTHSGCINWIGLDNSKIISLTDQSGIFNGEYWHGTFYKQLSNLLFQAVARPLLKHIIYSSIEDFIMPLELQNEVWRISKFEDILGKFSLYSDIFNLIKVDGEFKFNRDNFTLGEYIFKQEDLFLKNKECETILISAEILNSILTVFNEKSKDDLLDNIWLDLLLTQAHDNYAVPYVRPGDYSIQQLSKEEYKNLKLDSKRISISELSIQILKELQEKCKIFIENGLKKIASHNVKKYGKKKSSDINLMVFNPTIYDRVDIMKIPLNLENTENIMLFDENNEPIEYKFSDAIIYFRAKVPSIGYKIYTLKKLRIENIKQIYCFFYEIYVSKDNKAIEISYQNEKICEIKFKTSYEYSLSLNNQYKDCVEFKSIIQGKIHNETFKLEIVQYNSINRLEFILDNKDLNAIVLEPKIDIKKSFINYPFGIEETKRSEIQTLDFLWLKGKEKNILFIQKNSQKFIINRSNYEVTNLINKSGKYEFSISVMDISNHYLIYKQVYEYKFRLLGIALHDSNEYINSSNSFLSIKAPIKFVNLWRRKDSLYLRILNPNSETIDLEINSSLIKDSISEIDFNYNITRKLEKNQNIIEPWKIQNYEIL